MEYQQEDVLATVQALHACINNVVLDGMVYKYKRGETSILDVLVAQRTYNEVQQEYLETMKGYAASLVALESACGIWDICF